MIPKSIPLHGSSLIGPQQKIINAIARLTNTLHRSPHQLQVAIVAAYSCEKNGAFAKPRGELKSKGLIEYQYGGMLRASEFLFL
jgi:hypothetical protein